MTYELEAIRPDFPVVASAFWSYNCFKIIRLLRKAKD